MVTQQRPSTVYSTEHAEIYDFIHAARGRDWSAEADGITRLIRERCPEAGSLLDVACGTGAHLERFAEHFGTVVEASSSPRDAEDGHEEGPGGPRARGGHAAVRARPDL